MCISLNIFGVRMSSLHTISLIACHPLFFEGAFPLSFLFSSSTLQRYLHTEVQISHSTSPRPIFLIMVRLSNVLGSH